MIGRPRGWVSVLGTPGASRRPTGRRSCRSCPRPPRPHGSQRDSRSCGLRCGPFGSHQVLNGQPYPPQRVVERTQGNRHLQDHAQTHPGQRRAEESAARTSAQAPGPSGKDALGGYAAADRRQPSSLAGGQRTQISTVAGSGPEGHLSMLQVSIWKRRAAGVARFRLGE